MNMQVSSAVPEGKGVSSSASVEVASMAAIAAARGNFIYLIFQTLRTVFSGLNLLTSFYLLIKKKFYISCIWYIPTYASDNKNGFSCSWVKHQRLNLVIKTNKIVLICN